MKDVVEVFVLIRAQKAFPKKREGGRERGVGKGGMHPHGCPLACPASLLPSLPPSLPPISSSPSSVCVN